MEKETTTDKLDNVLKSTNPEDFNKFVAENSNNLVKNEFEFSNYMTEVLKSKHLKISDVSLLAGLNSKTCYDMFEKEHMKRTRDKVIRICVAAKFTLQETNKALRLSNLAELYSKVPRDALIIIGINKEIGDVDKLCELLTENKFEVLG